MGNYFASNSCHTSPHHLLTVYRGREIGRLSRKFLLILSARGQASSHFIDPMLSVPPFRLGFPDGKKLSNYVLPWRRTNHRGRHCCGYQGDGEVFNRTRKHSSSQNHGRNEAYPRNSPSVASAETTTMSNHLDGDGPEATVRVERGDHAAEMSRICSALIEAVKYAASAKQAALLFDYIKSFSTRSLEAYRKLQKTWVTDISPRVDNILGFVEPYRDPYGVKGDWEGAVCISGPHMTSKFRTLVDGSAKFIRMLPWAVPGENDGKGSLEASLFRAPNFTVIHCR